MSDINGEALLPVPEDSPEEDAKENRKKLEPYNGGRPLFPND